MTRSPLRNNIGSHSCIQYEGESPPFYGISYEIVSSWSKYKSVITSYEEAIAVNTHGEITPIPFGYNRESWTDEIGEAMLERRITWVHTAGYPFYYTWCQGESNKELWGEDGFKRLMSHVNLDNAQCTTYDQLVKMDVHDAAAANLYGGGWFSLDRAVRVQRGRPLRASDFENYTVLPIWGSEDGYMPGAVIAFVKPSERALPNERVGFGAYVHIGTNATFNDDDVDTGGDYWRGYVGVAAAIWTETLACESTGVTKEHIETNIWGELVDYAYCGLTVTPVVVSYEYFGGPDNKYIVYVDFFIFGAMKTNFSKTVGEVKFYLSCLPEGCMVKVDSYHSKNGHRYDNPTMGIDWGTAAKWGLKALIFFGGFYATGGAALVLKGISGAMLFSDFLSFNPTITDPINGVDELQPPNDYVSFKYDPEEYTETESGYTYIEFQSIIHIELTVDTSTRRQWNVIPMQWRVWMTDNYGGSYTPVKGDVSLAVYKAFNEDDYEATVFFEDFDDGMGGWSKCDSDPAGGYDYWGTLGGGSQGPPGSVAYCAKEGYNSVKDGENEEILFYDKCMNAYMERDVDLRPYQNTTLRYHLFYLISSGDYLAIEYYENGGWHGAETLTGSHVIDYWEETDIPTTAEKIRFRFCSNGDDDVGWGVFINNIEIMAEMPNDAGSYDDAGNDFDSAT